MAKFNESYENGKCPYGYEFVEGYTDRDFIMHASYCRKIRKVRIDPEEKHNQRNMLVRHIPKLLSDK
jgi:hypothetical protein